MSLDFKAIGKRVKEFRESKKLSQEILAENCNLSASSKIPAVIHLSTNFLKIIKSVLLEVNCPLITKPWYIVAKFAGT